MTIDVHGASPEQTIPTPEQRIRVFVSSTQGELAAERRVARAAIDRLHLSAVLFDLAPLPHPPRAFYRAYLRQSHVFVGIYRQRYGWVPPGESVSRLEDEFRLGEELPRLLYVKRSAKAVDPRLRVMLEEASRRGPASYRHFTATAELGPSSRPIWLPCSASASWH